MARVARAVAVGVPHDLTRRGHNRPDVFFVDENRAASLRLPRAHAERFDLFVYGYLWSGAAARLTGQDTAELLDLSEWRQKKDARIGPAT